MIVELQKTFGHIKFYEKDHKYIDTRNGNELISVTTEKKKFISEFPPDMYKWSAKKQGVDPDWLLGEWKRLAIEGQNRGTLLHNYCEALAFNKVIDIDMNAFPHMENLVNQIHNFFEDYKHWYTLAVECIIGDDVNGGLFDRTVEDSLNDNAIYIVDYKFQKSFRGDYGKNMLAPYSQYPQDTLHGYGWQLSKYKSILEKKGFKIDGMKIVHFNYEDTNYKVYDAPQIEIV